MVTDLAGDPITSQDSSQFRHEFREPGKPYLMTVLAGMIDWPRVGRFG